MLVKQNKLTIAKQNKLMTAKMQLWQQYKRNW